MPRIKDGELIYRIWHEKVKELLDSNELKSYSAKDRTLIEMDWQTFHQGTKAVRNGWRWFGRISRNTERTSKVTNEIRKQVQVYMEYPMEGW